jgi:L-alanine-DL-glutamate epimerase-like enolase superfamily enzyme
VSIVAVEAIPFRLPYREPLRMAAGDLTAAEHVLVRIHTDDGLVGQAEAPARPMFYGESLDSIVHAVRGWFTPHLLGADPFAVQAIRPLLDRVVANNTAKAAVDLALHDLRGQLTGQPVHRLLGGAAAPMRVTHMLGHGEPDAVAAEATRVGADFGISAFKIKVGYGATADLAVVGAVRAAVGDDALLYVDANCSYEPEEALRVLGRMAAEHHIAWVEEPVAPADRLGRRRVGASLPIPVLADETVPTLTDVAREVADGAARYVSIKVARTGFTVSADIAGLVHGHGGRVLLGSQGDSGIGTLASLAFGAASPRTSALPGELSYFLRLADDLLAEPLVIADGLLRAPDAPGLGVVIDEDKLTHYRLDKDR